MDVTNDSASKRRSNVRIRFWFQAALGGVFTGIFILTIAVPAWTEEVFGVDPDGGSGALEWLVVAVCAVAVVASLGLARTEWRRALRPPRITATD